MALRSRISSPADPISDLRLARDREELSSKPSAPAANSEPPSGGCLTVGEKAWRRARAAGRCWPPLPAAPSSTLIVTARRRPTLRDKGRAGSTHTFLIKEAVVGTSRRGHVQSASSQGDTIACRLTNFPRGDTPRPVRSGAAGNRGPQDPL